METSQPGAFVAMQLYYDDMLLPATLSAEGNDWKGKSLSCQSPSDDINGVRKWVCCDSCRSGGDDWSDDSEEPQRILYSCPDCGSRFGLSIALKYHIKKRHEPYRCNFCPFSSREASVTKRHSREVHCLEKRHCCPHCKYRAKRSTHLRRHMEARHKPGAVPVESEELYSCSLCTFSTAKPKSLKRHISNNHSVTTLQCEQCDFQASESRKLKHHVKTVHENIKDYDCPCCDYRTVHLGSLKNHIMAKHTDEKDHKCPYCPYSAVQSGNLKRHLLTKHPTKKIKIKKYNPRKTTSNSNTVKQEPTIKKE